MSLDKLCRKHINSKHCGKCEEFDRTEYWDKYPKKCKCGGLIHHEVSCRGWDRTSFGWSSHIIQCDGCGTWMSFNVDIDGWDGKSFEEQYWKSLKCFSKELGNLK